MGKGVRNQSGSLPGLVRLMGVRLWIPGGELWGKAPIMAGLYAPSGVAGSLFGSDSTSLSSELEDWSTYLVRQNKPFKVSQRDCFLSCIFRTTQRWSRNTPLFDRVVERQSQ